MQGEVNFIFSWKSIRKRIDDILKYPKSEFLCGTKSFWRKDKKSTLNSSLKAQKMKVSGIISCNK
jgi:hypothetical protein